jgi:conjugal transfer pilus assembly protein TraB
MLDKLKDKFSALTPKQKKIAIFGVPAAVVVMFFVFGSDTNTRPVIPNQNVSTVGAFGIDDEEVTVGDLTTRISAMENQIQLLAQKDNTTAASLKRIEDMMQSISGTEANIQTLYEINRRLGEMEEQIERVELKAVTPRETKSTITFVDPKANDKVLDEGENEILIPTETGDATPAGVAKKESFGFDKEAFSFESQREKTPDDPLAFLNNAANNQNQVQTVTDRNNMFIDSDNQQIISTTNTTIAMTDEAAKSDDSESGAPEFKGKRVLAGATMPVILVSGFDAPTGQATSENAVSATVRITGPAIMANGYSVDLTGCLVTNLVRGDAATERANLRPDRLTCKYEYGEVDIPIQGFLSGKDGSAGLRGRLVNNKRNKILIYGSITGAISGLGQAFGGGNNQQIAVGGTGFELPNTRDASIASVSSGVSQAADFLTEYYQAKLNEYYDVIEIKPLVSGTLHVMTTFRMELLED